ncbi:MAG: oligosaccharide flippase family protein [Candidatus Cloacimonadales bacterium]
MQKLKSLFKKQVETWKSLVDKGLIHIFGANTLAKFLFMLSSILLVRFLSVEVYGFWANAFNIFTLLTLLQGAGSNVGIIQFCSKDQKENKARRLFLFGNRLSVVANAIILILSLIFLSLYEFKIPNTNKVVAILAVSMFFLGLADNYKNYFRATLRNKEFSYSVLFFAIYRSTSLLILGYFFSLTGLIISQISSHLFDYLFCRYLDKERITNLPILESKVKNEFMKFSLISLGNNVISRLLYLIDTFLVGQILASSTLVAHYKTATLLPSNLIFIPESLILFIYPYIRKNVNDKKYVKSKYISVLKKLALINFSITACLYVLAPLVVRILFTDKYNGSIPALRVLLIGFFFAGTFRIPAGNFIAAVHKIKINVVITGISGVLNIALDYLFIVKYGIIGAAYATTLVFILNSLMSNGYLIYYFKRGTYESSLSE